MASSEPGLSLGRLSLSGKVILLASASRMCSSEPNQVLQPEPGTTE